MIKIKQIWNKINSSIRERPLFWILLLSLVVRIFYLSLHHPLWWDAHVYIGMGKYIYSNGEIGIWESFRPPVLPLLLGAVWKLHLNPIIMGKLFDLLFSLLAIYLTYLVGRKAFSEEVGLVSSLIFSFNAIFIMHTGLILTEPLAITLSLAGIYFFLNATTKIHLFISGLLLGLSFLTKFPEGIIFGTIFIVLLFQKERSLNQNILNKNILKEHILKGWSLTIKIKNIALYSSGFMLAVLPYLIFNYYRYPNLLEPFVSGSKIVITSAWVYGSGYTFYLLHFFFRYWIYLFFFVYFYYFYKEKQWLDSKKMTLLLAGVFMLLYFTLVVPRKEIRYMVTIVPFLAVFVAYTLLNVYKTLKSQPKPVLRPLAFILICTILIAAHTPTMLYLEKTPTFEKEVMNAIKEYNVTGTILTSDPAFVSFVNQPIVILSAGMEFGPIIYSQQKSRYQLLFLNDCDFICPPGDQQCAGQKVQFLSLIEEENERIFTQTFKNCTYSMLLPTFDRK